MNSLTFIVGCPRSGTYLLSSMLNLSGQIAIPTETHFIPLFARYAPLFGDLRNADSRRRLLRDIYTFLEIWLARAEAERDLDHVLKYSLLATRGSIDSICMRSRSYADIVCALFEDYASLHSALLFGDKSAFFHHNPLEQIDAALEGRAKFLHIVRDGRDVCLSWMRLSVGPKTIAGAAEAWRNHIIGNYHWGEQHPDRYCEVRYEDLLGEPEQVLRRVCKFIGIDFNPAMLLFHHGEMAQAIANSSTHSMLAKPLDPHNRNKWEGELSSDAVALFEYIARNELGAMGYRCVTTRAPAWDKATIAIISGIRELVSYKNLRLILKGLLPLAIILTGRMGIRLERIVNSKIWVSLECMPVAKRIRRS